MNGSRLMLWQAQERFPDAVWAPLGGAVAHALKERLEWPARFCFAVCGQTGFADETMDADALCCLRCTAFLSQPDTEEDDARA